MNDTIGVGIIGAGGISHTHVRALGRDCADLTRVVAVADISEERARALAAAAGGAATHTDYRELLERPDVRFVEVLTQPGLHREIAIAALEAGKHVAIIKPFTVSLADADAIIVAAERAEGSLFAAQPMRYDPAMHTVAELARSGDLGDPVRIYARSFLQLAWLEKPQGWYYDLTQSGGVTVETLVHALDLMAWIYGPATRAHAEAGTYYTRDRERGLPDDQMAALYRFANGAFGVLEGAGSQALGVPASALEVIGTEGAVWLDAERGGRVHISRTRATSGAVETRVVPGPFGGEGGMLRAYLKVARDGAPPPVTGADGRYAVELAWGAIESYRTGATVALPFDRAAYPTFG